MFICDGCQREFDFGTSIGGLALCDECIKPYDQAFLRCRSQRDHDELVRRVRAEILRPCGKGR